MKNLNGEHASVAESQPQEERRWQTLYERITEILLNRTKSLLGAEAIADEETFNRSARALRLLMSSADIARRMKDRDDKEKELNEQAPQEPQFTDEEIRGTYERVRAQVERVAEADAPAQGDRQGNGGIDQENQSRQGAANLGGNRP